MSLIKQFWERFPGETDVIWIYKTEDGTNEECCEEDKALVFLFAQDFCLYVHGTECADVGQATISVISNDIFMWGCADSDPLPVGQIPILYMMVKLDPKWGSIKWLCEQRKLQPQSPVKKDMIKDGSWSDELEALEKNPDSK